MSGSNLSALFQLVAPIFRLMRHTALLFALLILNVPASAGAGNNGNGNQSLSAAGNGNGFGHDKTDGGSSGNSNRVLSPEGAAAASDQNRALQAVKDGDALPLSEIAKRVRSLFGARLLDAQFVSRGTELIYRLTILTDLGVSTRIDLDAKTGMPAGGR